MDLNTKQVSEIKPENPWIIPETSLKGIFHYYAGKIYLINCIWQGGYNLYTGPNVNYYREIFIYDVESNTWSKKFLKGDQRSLTYKAFQEKFKKLQELGKYSEAARLKKPPTPRTEADFVSETLEEDEIPEESIGLMDDISFPQLETGSTNYETPVRRKKSNKNCKFRLERHETLGQRFE